MHAAMTSNMLWVLIVDLWRFEAILQKFEPSVHANFKGLGCVVAYWKLILQDCPCNPTAQVAELWLPILLSCNFLELTVSNNRFICLGLHLVLSPSNHDGSTMPLIPHLHAYNVTTIIVQPAGYSRWQKEPGWFEWWGPGQWREAAKELQVHCRLCGPGT